MSARTSIIDDLTEKGWTSPGVQEHVLGDLQGKTLEGNPLIVMMGPKNRFGATYFQAFLRNALGETSQKPVIKGLHSQGRYPAYNWIEVINLAPKLRFGSREEISLSIPSHTTVQLFRHLADLLPPGGHMMVEYDSPGQRDTARSLTLGIPPIATPLGYLLFLVGCGNGFRDWYFAEGGSEGPRKLQGHKALNSQHARIKAEETSRELTIFLDRLSTKNISELERAARDRALDILERL
ncbi:MAG: DUF1122 family protein [Dehalococcoidia bacterium]